MQCDHSELAVSLLDHLAVSELFLPVVSAGWGLLISLEVMIFFFKCGVKHPRNNSRLYTEFVFSHVNLIVRDLAIILRFLDG